MSTEPEALRLAQDLKDYWDGMELHHVAALHRCAAVMLREQHAEILRLQAAHDHQYQMAGLMLREAERNGRECDELRSEIERLRAALRDIARQPEGDEESAQLIARAVLKGGDR